MPVIVIDSPDDPRLAPYRNIRHRDPTEDANSAISAGRTASCDDGNSGSVGLFRFIAEGRLVVERLLSSKYRCESLVVEKDHHPDLVAAALAKEETTDILQLDVSVLRHLVGFDFHRGILACGQSPPLPTMRELGDEWFLRPTSAPMLVVCGVNNPENIGGLMRTATAFGVSRMGISSDVASPFSRRALRVSMASALKLDIFRLNEETEGVKLLTDRYGYRTCATALGEGTKTLTDFCERLRQTPINNRKPLALIMGSEAAGLSKKTLEAASDLVTIPMQMGTDSLNVNVATAIFLYELTK